MRMRHLISSLTLALIASSAFAASFYRVAAGDVETAVSKALAEQGAATSVQAKLFSAKPTLYEADKPLSVAVHALRFERNSLHWQAEMYIISEGKTLSVTPIQGRYEPLVRIPVLTRAVQESDIITASDIGWENVVQRTLRKDSIQQEADLIGKSPRRSISPGRPVRLGELALPTLVKKGEQVAVNYSTPHMHIQTLGQALEDGSLGGLIRVRNLDSKRAFTARVVAEGKVEANMQTTLNN